jgi:hypothetical protein
VIAGAELLEAIRAVVREELVRALQPPPLKPKHQRLAELLPSLYAPGQQFTTADVLDLARQQPGIRRELAEVLRNDFDNRLPRIGMALRAIADSGATFDGLRLVAVEDAGRAWELERVRSR